MFHPKILLPRISLSLNQQMLAYRTNAWKQQEKHVGKINNNGQAQHFDPGGYLANLQIAQGERKCSQ